MAQIHGCDIARSLDGCRTHDHFSRVSRIASSALFPMQAHVVSIALLLTLSSCESLPDVTPGIGALEIVGAPTQELFVGANAVALVVRALDQSAAPAPGITVNWTIVSGGGALSATSSVTDAAGMASVSYTPPATPSSVFVRAVAEGLSVTFTINVRGIETTGNTIR